MLQFNHPIFDYPDNEPVAPVIIQQIITAPPIEIIKEVLVPMPAPIVVQQPAEVSEEICKQFIDIQPLSPELSYINCDPILHSVSEELLNLYTSEKINYESYKEFLEILKKHSKGDHNIIDPWVSDSVSCLHDDMSKNPHPEN